MAFFGNFQLYKIKKSDQIQYNKVKVEQYSVIPEGIQPDLCCSSNLVQLYSVIHIIQGNKVKQILNFEMTYK